ncbi:glycine cleavage system protein H [Thermocrinis minervae]|uniref:Glycine cleavage system H protein n=1 Tax=Thermocrinis minervae TaxID=381751 RepID=A0A1M6SW42_9AQUI|nr:glycine cleavage system protein H [Thermocrinis minervae]SHK48788.1 glycine cleavage system H protein [Thermocrinis minervae]
MGVVEAQGPTNEWEYNGCIIPLDLYYEIETQTWLRINDDGTVTMGLTDVGQVRAGRLLHARIKSPGKHIQKGKPVASLESGKWAGPINALVEGEVVEANQKVLEQPDIINYDPYGEGWIVKMKPTNLERDIKDLLYGPQAIEEMKKYIDEWDIICMRCT